MRPSPALEYRDNNNSGKKPGYRNNDQTRPVEVQDQSPSRRQFVGPSEEPHQPPRLSTRPARPAPPQALGLRHPAHGEAEAERLLRQYRREAIPQILRGGGDRKSTRLNSSN